ncbi:unnamed protein product (mitochondrion) [Plasmodiophora brassicae]|uniref:FYVE-type domain-containing protein n=1 Tax=Plasmodiophora brassicae TaxID=37360 RepID=A0A0G4ILS4_PLABS|nr:hypothetical protein PBRA_004789 [Plasmodiophora brassicae]SPQ93357.1 unnamed protein product [Plasmodiophora brassicae]
MEDPQRLIADWIPPDLKPPVWVDRKAYSACRSCGQTFHGKPFHCRLCGEMFDDKCTAKYHVPDTFKVKNKPGPCRVCFGCRNLCMAYRDHRTGMNLTDARKPMFRCNIVDGIRHIYPPAGWQTADVDGEMCKTCCRTGVKRHHCLVCGELSCGDCSSKMDVPRAFNLKQKSGPQRVCNECRFLIVEGAVLCEFASQGQFLPFQKVFTPRTPQSQKASPPTSLAQPTVPETAIILRVEWADGDGFVTNLKVGELWDLDIINKVLCDQCVLEREFVYLCKGRPVAREHWTAFIARDLRPTLYIRRASFTIRYVQ